MNNPQLTLRLKWLLCLLVCAFVLSGCQTESSTTQTLEASTPSGDTVTSGKPKLEPGEPKPELTHCDPENRPQMCTREYRPVCALVDTGTRCVTTPCPSTKWQTQGNACDACAREQVIAFKPGQCAVGE